MQTSNWNSRTSWEQVRRPEMSEQISKAVKSGAT